MAPKSPQRQQPWLIRNRHALPGIRCLVAVVLAVPLAVWCAPQLISRAAVAQPQNPLLLVSDLGADATAGYIPAAGKDAAAGVQDAAAAAEAALASKAADAAAAAAQQDVNVSSGVELQTDAAGPPAADSQDPDPAAGEADSAGTGDLAATAPSAAHGQAQGAPAVGAEVVNTPADTAGGDLAAPAAVQVEQAGRHPAEHSSTLQGAAPSAASGGSPGGPSESSWKYWQQALMSANASGLPPPVHRGNWMYAAHARLRWFEPNGKPRYMRPWTWWAYEDPAPPPGTQQAAQPAADGGSGATGSSEGAAGGGQLSDSQVSDRTREFTKRRWATDASDADATSGRGGGSDGVDSSAGSSEAGGTTSSNSSNGGGSSSSTGSSSSDGMDDAEQRRLRRLTGAKDRSGHIDADGDGESADAWAIRTPPLQEKPALDAGERSHYLPWIKRDLRPWAKRGIRQSDIDAAASLSTPIGPYCYGDQLLFQIVGGRLHIEFKTSNWNDRQMPDGSKQRYDGWFPGNEGPGLAVAKGRVPYVLFMLLDVLRAFPGQVPDVSGMIHTSDFPCLRVSEDVPDTDKRNPDIKVPPQHYEGRPIPVFGYNRKEGFMDLVLPDYSWYGHEYSQLTDPNGLMLNGWPQQLDVVVATHGATPLAQRLPRVMWRGRAEAEPRDEVRRRFKACPRQLDAAGHDDAGELFDVVAPKIYELTGTTLLDNGRYRYPVYIDAGAFSSNLKQKLAAGSPLLRVHQRYHEWYTRALVHGWTHVEVADNDTMCEDVYAKVTLMEEMVAEQAAAVAAANHPPPWLQPRADSWYQHPWGVYDDSDAAAFQQLRDWTLAQRGIAAGGMNAYEDSDLYVAPPEELTAAAAAAAAAPDTADGGSGADAAHPAAAESGKLTGASPAEAVLDPADVDAAAGLAPDPAPAEGAQQQQGSAAGGVDDVADASRDRRQQRRHQRRQLSGQGLVQHSEQWSQSAGGVVDRVRMHVRQRHARRRLLQARQQEAAEAARREWDARQAALRDAVPWGLWNRSRAAWGSDLLPWEIGAFGQMFARDRLRMHDLRLYVRDLLTEYAELQRFDVKPSHHARCMDWDRMLAEFEWPHYSKDADKLLHFYPYIRSPFNYNCSADLREADKAPYTPGHDGAGDTFKGDEGWQAEWRTWLEGKLEAQGREREADARKRQEKEEANRRRRQKRRQQQQHRQQ